MAYTSYTPNNERFGFSMKGNFRCVYGWERLFIIFGGAVILAEITGMIIIASMLKDLYGSNVEISVYITDPFNYGLYAIALATTLYATLACVAIYMFVLAVAKTGRVMTFFANEEYFDICPSKNGRHIILYYDEVIGVTADERKFPLMPGGLDITVITKREQYVFSYVHPEKSKAGGLCETPFNIVMERAGLVPPPDMFLGR